MKWKFWHKGGKEVLKTTIDNEKYVPYAILNDKYKNTDIQGTAPKIYEKDGYLVKEYSCGCKFESKIDSFGFSNHWCDEHAERHSFSSPTVQTINNKEGGKT